jgi:hypothetical protein
MPTKKAQKKEVAAPQREFVMPKKSKVCIVGCADSKDEAPFADPNGHEFWGVNNLFLTMPGPWSRWFDLHTFSDGPGGWLRRGEPNFRGQPVDKYLTAVQALNVPVYMQAPCELVPNAVTYPINDMIEMFGTYFTNTISYMIALAIVEKFEEIKIVGVDMAVDSEYSHQRPSCEYFIGVARGRGINVYLPDTCDLLKTRFLYAFHEVQETAFDKKMSKMGQSMKKRREKAMGQMEAHEKQRKFFERQMYEYNGAIAANDQSKIHWSNTVNMWPTEKPTETAK